MNRDHCPSTVNDHTWYESYERGSQENPESEYQRRVDSIWQKQSLFICSTDRHEIRIQWLWYLQTDIQGWGILAGHSGYQLADWPHNWIFTPHLTLWISVWQFGSSTLPVPARILIWQIPGFHHIRETSRGRVIRWCVWKPSKHKAGSENTFPTPYCDNKYSPGLWSAPVCSKQTPWQGAALYNHQTSAGVRTVPVTMATSERYSTASHYWCQGGGDVYRHVAITTPGSLWGPGSYHMATQIKLGQGFWYYLKHPILCLCFVAREIWGGCMNPGVSEFTTPAMRCVVIFTAGRLLNKFSYIDPVLTVVIIILHWKIQCRCADVISISKLPLACACIVPTTHADS